MPRPAAALLGASVLTCALLTGCHMQYVTPGAGADLYRAMSLGDPADPDRSIPFSIAEQLGKKPAAALPATLATLRIQDAGYRSYSHRGTDSGSYSIVTVRDVEQPEDIERIASLPMIEAVVPLNKMVVGHLSSEQDFRAAAARVQADALLLYTFDTTFDTDTTIPALGVLTLGLFPNEEAHVTSTASALLIDTRTGFIYAVAESTHQTKQLANAWTSGDAVDQSRRRAEREAFTGLVDQLVEAWPKVLRTHAVQVLETGAMGR